ncbi:DUF4133 domain-containing protein [Myroides marinus]|uniref:Conjugal transfer protein TraF n=1 Tax=Myroides marinus TaxID=703342 RepID=A0A163WS61_9FLAO|nr:DUF4133 domain-containing protein [Myroides marinus]KZE76758.1 conjugal transfer protein TraF [Myroides marinus]MDM1346439.1 DUF4133 domain-containing protein [Myroides marinus]MDM1349857.1 DUF4133 domain-containing protein [Myroides marinus]MDM1354781.1 DUF4133 domain-containing protein [Myroides marinus]MDM1357065.1 DUF4133 domain-containing protein [Myroides marinus]
MKKYSINKGIGTTVEFKGLKAQYLFYFAAGLLADLILVMVLYMAGVNNLVCLALGLSTSGYLVYKVFSLNKKYGQYGLMKLQARKYFPRYIISRKNLRGCLSNNFKLSSYEKYS